MEKPEGVRVWRDKRGNFHCGIYGDGRAMGPLTSGTWFSDADLAQRDEACREEGRAEERTAQLIESNWAIAAANETYCERLQELADAKEQISQLRNDLHAERLSHAVTEAALLEHHKDLAAAQQEETVLQCSKCNTQYEMPDDYDHTSSGVFCPACRQGGEKLVGVCHPITYRKTITQRDWNELKDQLAAALIEWAGQAGQDKWVVMCDEMKQRIAQLEADLATAQGIVKKACDKTKQMRELATRLAKERNAAQKREQDTQESANLRVCELCDKLEAAQDRVKELERVEWIDIGEKPMFTDHICPWCMNHLEIDEGHAPDCVRKR